MPCPSCGADPLGGQFVADPLRWDLDPPCTEPEWNYLRDVPQAPEWMQGKSHCYLQNICRKCYNDRIQVCVKVRTRIRECGGIEQMKPTQRMKKEYAQEHENDVVLGRAARIQGLQSEAAQHLNGQYCKIMLFDKESERFSCELVNGEQKALKKANLEASSQIDKDYMYEKGKHLFENPEQLKKECEAVPRPLGAKTTWPKVKGIHPGAVVRLDGLKGAAHLNGRKGRCIAFDSETGRWEIDMGDERKSIKQDNLTPAPKEKPPTKDSAEQEKRELHDGRERRSKMQAKEVHAEDYGWDG